METRRLSQTRDSKHNECCLISIRRDCREQRRIVSRGAISPYSVETTWRVQGLKFPYHSGLNLEGLLDYFITKKSFYGFAPKRFDEGGLLVKEDVSTVGN